MPLTAGARLGAYEILAPLGAGGMGEVYRARDTRLDRTVAIKVLPAHIASDSQLRERFDREARTISQLNNSHICAIYDLGETAVTRTDAGPGPESAERVNFLVFEYLPGQTLADRLKQGPVAVTEAIDIATQIADALADAHGHAIVHRDLKPANVMLIGASGERVVKLLDFGLAKPTAASRVSTSGSTLAPTAAALTSEGSILGTFQYMAPEQFQGQATTDGTDIWAFGCVLHEMLTGRDVRVRGRVRPRGLNRLIDRCLAIDPADRPRAKEVVRELRAIERRIAWRGLIGKVGVAAAAAVLTLAAVATMRLLKSDGQPPSNPVTILIADFDNQTSEAVFDGTVEHAIGLALEDSRFVSMYSRRDASQAANLIESGARLDERISRLVAQREGINLVLSGVVAPERAGYVISAHLVDPRPGVVIAVANERISDRSRALEAIGRLGQALRRALGEREATAALPSDETFTTSSLDAAREYVVAQSMLGAGREEEAAAHYQRALQHDSRMGRAYAGWAVVDHDLGRHDDARAHMAKALDLLPRMNRREQLRTQGVNAALLMGDYRLAVEVNEQLHREYPTDATGLNNLAVAKFMLLDFAGAKRSGADVVQLFPNRHLYRMNLALYSMYAGDFEIAVREAKEAIALNPKSGGGHLPLAVSAAFSGNLSEARHWYEEMSRGDPRAQRLAATCLADLLMYTGDLRQPRAMLTSAIATDIAARSAESAAGKELLLAEIDLLDGKRESAATAAARATSLIQTPQIVFRAAMILVDAGRVDQAASVMNTLPQQLQGPDLWYRLVADAAVGVARSDSTALARLESRLEKERGTWLAHLHAGRLRLQTGGAAAASRHFAWCIEHRPEGSAAYLDDVATLRYWADAWYGSSLANEAAGDLQAAKTSYESFLAPRRDAQDLRTQDIRRRLATSIGSRR